MAYDSQLAVRIREHFSDFHGVEEKEMMGGLAFMYNKKMCVGIIKDEMMLRIDPTLHDTVVERPGCRAMDFTGKIMKGWILVDSSGMRSNKDFNYWIDLALEFNKKAKASKKAPSKSKKKIRKE